VDSFYRLRTIARISMHTGYAALNEVPQVRGAFESHCEYDPHTLARVVETILTSHSHPVCWLIDQGPLPT
jgi:hypothetical protein